MSRAPFQVLVIPFRITITAIEYAIFRREPNAGGYWQGIAGGGEIGESPIETAKRETFEEAGISTSSPYFAQDSMAKIPVENICGFRWGEDLLVIPEYAFGVEVDKGDINLSDEHTEIRWTTYTEAMNLLHWDSNKTALWELDFRIKRTTEILAKNLKDQSS